jgi:hypothetical protein
VSSRVAPVDVYLSNTGVVRRATSRYVYVPCVLLGRFVSAGSYEACHPRDPDVSSTTRSAKNQHGLWVQGQAKVVRAAEATAGGVFYQRRPSLRPSPTGTEITSEWGHLTLGFSMGRKLALTAADLSNRI